MVTARMEASVAVGWFASGVMSKVLAIAQPHTAAAQLAASVALTETVAPGHSALLRALARLHNVTLTVCITHALARVAAELTARH